MSTSTLESVSTPESLVESESKGHEKFDKNDSLAWQTKCFELESSMQKFREQAQNIREMLREKVGLRKIMNFAISTLHSNKDLLNFAIKFGQFLVN